MTYQKSANVKAPLNVAVCGWYFTDEWYASLLRLQEKGVASVFVVANRSHPLLALSGLEYAIRPNMGLEFGAYNTFLESLWTGGPIIFCHDDLKFEPVMTGDMVIKSGEDNFHRLGELDIDQGYVFNSRQDDTVNWGKHGRMIFMSESLAKWVLSQGGIWFDKENKHNYNAGINAFEEMMVRAADAGFDTRNKIYFPGLSFGHRGKFKGRMIA